MFIESPVLVLLHSEIFPYGKSILGVLDDKECLWDGRCLDGLHCIRKTHILKELYFVPVARKLLWGIMLICWGQSYNICWPDSTRITTNTSAVVQNYFSSLKS